MSTSVTHVSSVITTAATIQWSSAENFNGFLLMLGLPSGGRSSLYLRGEQRLRVPLDAKIPIIDGALCDFSRVWQTTEFDPPNALYCDIWYDNTRAKIATGAALFSITADPFTVTVPTLTVPTAGSTRPDPDVPLSDSSVIGTNLVTPTIEKAAGTGSAVTISNTPSQIWGVYFNGILMQEGGGADYTVVTTTITFNTLTVGASDIIMVIYVF